MNILIATVFIVLPCFDSICDIHELSYGNSLAVAEEGVNLTLYNAAPRFCEEVDDTFVCELKDLRYNPRTKIIRLNEVIFKDRFNEVPYL